MLHDPLFRDTRSRSFFQSHHSFGFYCILAMLSMCCNSIRFIYTFFSFSSFFSLLFFILKKNNCILFRLCYDKIKSKMNFIQRKKATTTKNGKKEETGAYLSLFHSCECARMLCSKLDHVVPCRAADCVNLTHRYTKCSHIYVNII